MTRRDAMRARKPDWPGAVAAAFLAVGGYVVIQSLGMTAMGAVFPRTIGGVLLALSALELLRRLTGRGNTAPQDGERGGSAALAGIILAWALLFPVVGFVVTSLVASLSLMAVAAFHRVPPRALGIRILLIATMVALFYWLMTAVLNIPIPRAWLI